MVRLVLKGIQGVVGEQNRDTRLVNCSVKLVAKTFELRTDLSDLIIPPPRLAVVVPLVAWAPVEDLTRMDTESSRPATSASTCLATV